MRTRTWYHVASERTTKLVSTSLGGKDMHNNRFINVSDGPTQCSSLLDPMSFIWSTGNYQMYL